MNHSASSRLRRNLAFTAGLMVLVCLATGCAPPLGTVSGKVTYRNQIVPGGWVLFTTTNPSGAHQTPIDETGHYEITLPVGDAQICVDNRDLGPPPKAPKLELPAEIKLPAEAKLPPVAKGKPGVESNLKGSPKGGSRYIEIPFKYYRNETSELVYTVKSGTQTFNIELK